MPPILALVLVLVATRNLLKGNLQVQKDEIKEMLEREEYVHQEMTRLLEEIVGSSGPMEMLLSFAWQHQCLLWASAAVLLLVLLAMGCWLVRRRKRGCGSCRELKCFKKYVMVASKEPSGEEDLSSTKGLKELLDELLGVCRVLSRRNFMPELHLVAGTYSSCEVCSVQENSSTYRPLVLLRPPPGHSFIPESTEHPSPKGVSMGHEVTGYSFQDHHHPGTAGLGPGLPQAAQAVGQQGWPQGSSAAFGGWKQREATCGAGGF
ncbi:uncharacterized protein LOC111941864 [Cyanistes caeruleus]|uniref:uncharacterized protein LOC111941864 n=1 Tax=Cyanistes caeruleus TaxID=156563 RepID=UPI000CDB6C49|nr:uncharacterized protein LOC111941864 [Cyanistes caeruleus]